MARIKKLLPPNETVRWEMLARGSSVEIAVTDRHVIWADGILDRDKGALLLADIRFVDLEEGGNSVNFYCDGTVHRIEELTPGKLEELAGAIGRPARIWRECKAPGTVKARRWRLYSGVVFAVLSSAVLFGLVSLAFGDAVFKGANVVVGMMFVVLPAQWFGSMARAIFPHFLVGRRLSGEERRDFVGWMTDLRWQGVKPDGPDDERSPRSRLGDWAMRKAYGEIPDIGEREPEILIRGEFPD